VCKHRVPRYAVKVSKCFAVLHERYMDDRPDNNITNSDLDNR